MRILHWYTALMSFVFCRSGASARAVWLQRGTFSGTKRRIAVAAMAAVLAGCTGAAPLLLAALPDGTLSVLLGKLQSESDGNRRRVAELEQAADWAGLAQFAEQNIAKEHNNASWWMVAGYAYSRQLLHVRAIESFQEMVRLEPQAPEGWNLLAQEYRAAGDPRQAISVLTRALTAVRDAPVTHMLLGESYNDVGRFDLAERAYRQALDLDAGLTPAWVGLARSQIKLGRPAEAERIARALERSDPQLAATLRQEVAGAPRR